MANTETVIIDDVKQDGPWFNVHLTDDNRVLSTKAKKLGDLAMSLRGQEVEVEVNSKGNYSYLNSINGTKEGRSAAPSNGSARKSAPPRGGNDDERQRRIQAQWAYGRAAELLTLTDATLDVKKGLTDEVKTFLNETAAFLLEQTS